MNVNMGIIIHVNIKIVFNNKLYLIFTIIILQILEEKVDQEIATIKQLYYFTGRLK